MRFCIPEAAINLSHQCPSLSAVFTAVDREKNQPKCFIEISENDLETGSAKVAASIDWKPNEETVFPVNLEVTFDGPKDLPNWHWLSGEIFSSELKLETIPSLIPFLESVHAVLDNKDISGLQGLVKNKSEEMATAYGIPLEERLADQIEFFSDLFSAPDWKMKPFNPDQIFLQIEGMGHLLLVTNLTGGPALQTEDFEDGSNFGLKFYLCFLEGKWEIAR